MSALCQQIRFPLLALVILTLAACRLETTARVSFTDIADALSGQRVETTAELVVWAPIGADRASEQGAEIQQALERFIPGIRYVRFQQQRGAMDNGLVFEFPALIARGETQFSSASSPLSVSLTGNESDGIMMQIEVDAQRIANARRAIAQRNPMMHIEDRQFVFRIILENDTRNPVEIETWSVFVDGRAMELDKFRLERRRSVLIELSNHASVRLLTPGVGRAVVFRSGRTM